jgi:putative flippase GtrA
VPAHRHSLIRFGLVGFLGLGFDVTLLALLVQFTPLHRWSAIAPAFVVTYLLNFVLNRRFAFAVHDAPPGPIGRQIVRFLPQLALDLALTLASVRLLTAIGLPLLVARVLAGGSNAAVNYIAYRWWTFRAPVAAADRWEPDPDPAIDLGELSRNVRAER